MNNLRVCPTDWRVIEDENGNVVADVRVSGPDGGREISRLIAAASEMLKLLKRLTSSVGSSLATDEARALIARLEGTPPSPTEGEKP